ncbi:hypothetical protein WSM22_44470 [Cytophagales bacterium WSM2-2]|nr:hypothetical protein WSM22_44470 [Cytophagales bacterium WSM2-2]
MKLFLKPLVFVLLSASFGLAQTSGPTISWDKDTHDFGDIIQGEKVEHVFKFTNAGSEPLIITNVEVTCGCTTPRGWPRDPIKPGDKGEITVQFDSAHKFGRQNKVATVISNVTSGKSQITFSANVLEKKK